jgi:hypothetical protein
MAFALGLLAELLANTARVLGLIYSTRTIAIVCGYDCTKVWIDFNYHVSPLMSAPQLGQKLALKSHL